MRRTRQQLTRRGGRGARVPRLSTRGDVATRGWKKIRIAAPACAGGEALSGGSARGSEDAPLVSREGIVGGWCVRVARIARIRTARLGGEYLGRRPGRRRARRRRRDDRCELPRGRRALRRGARQPGRVRGVAPDDVARGRHPRANTYPRGYGRFRSRARVSRRAICSRRWTPRPSALSCRHPKHAPPNALIITSAEPHGGSARGAPKRYARVRAIDRLRTLDRNTPRRAVSDRARGAI